MSLSIRKLIAAAGLVFALGLAPQALAVPVAPGYVVSEIALPDTVAGDVVVVGGALFVGVGPGFSGTAQSVIRIDSGGTTVVADGFNSLGGFAYDAVNDRLIVSDNALEAPFSETGDNVYEISNPLGAFATPVRAKDVKLLADGALPGVADIVLDPTDLTGQTLLLTDSNVNSVQRVDLSNPASTPANLFGTVGFAAGLAADSSQLFYGAAQFDANFNSDGNVGSAPLPGATPQTNIVTGLPGQFDLELEAGGTLLSTSGSSLLRIDPITGNTATVATGFGFAAGLFESAGTIWVVDGGFPPVSSVFQLTPVPEPGTALLLGSGLIGLLAAGRRLS